MPDLCWIERSFLQETTLLLLPGVCVFVCVRTGPTRILQDSRQVKRRGMWVHILDSTACTHAQFHSRLTWLNPVLASIQPHPA